jgi:hypothetical protein
LVVGIKHKRPYRECREWNERLWPILLELRPDLIVTSHATDYELADAVKGADTARRLAEGYADALNKLTSKGLKLLAIRDTPLMGFDVADCVSAKRATLQKCSRSRDQALPGPTFHPEGLEANQVLDLSELICKRDSCPPVVGGVLVYRDSNHLTATYAKTLAPFLWSRVHELLGH